jgi:uncharacterized protein YwgA
VAVLVEYMAIKLVVVAVLVEFHTYLHKPYSQQLTQ